MAARVCMVLFAMLLLHAVPCAGAGPLGGGTQQEFRFYFSVKGYEADSWFGEPTALALDESHGIIYVADKKNGTVDAFSLKGVPRFRYGSKNGLKAPIGLAVDRHGDVYVSESEGGPIKVIDSHGDVSTLEIPADQDKTKEPPKPGQMTFDRDGNLYVVDRENCQVIVFDKERRFRCRFGTIGEKRGEFKILQDIAVDRQSRIYATDLIQTPVQIFDGKGNHIYCFGSHSEVRDGLSFPMGVFVDRQDQVWVVDKNQHSLKVFDRAGIFLRSFGNYGQGEGSFFYPIDAVMDSLGRVYVLEAGARRLQVFSLNRPFEPFGP